MTDRRSLKRREFLGRSTAAVEAGLAAAHSLIYRG